MNTSTKPNQDIRNLAHGKNVYLWQIAPKLGISETTLLRWLRNDLDHDTRKKIVAAINEIARG